MPHFSKPFARHSYAAGDEDLEKRVFFPFYHAPCNIPCLVLKLIFGIIAVPVRFVFIVLVVLLTTAIVRLIMLFQKPGAHPGGLRSFLLKQVVRASASTILAAVGCLRVSVRGRPATRRRGFNPPYVPNHQSPVDILLMLKYGGFSFIAKAETRRLPGVGPVSAAIDSLFVDRKDPDSRERTLAEMVRRVRDGERYPLVVFPEGGTSSGRALLEFRAGVFRTGRPVQPIAIRYRAPFSSVAWDVQPSLAFIASLLSSPFFFATVTFLPVYYPEPPEVEDSYLYAENVRHVIAKQLRIPCSPLNFKEKFAFEDYCFGRCAFDDVRALVEGRLGADLDWSRARN
eukprot:gnl/Chilomastix_cuspidata/1179.p2 GENE.gnl/Chilomastix_cuspidata/1179~~gnl/Chilomastix_cuspidata/1179.p2  ORF type:complete len:342 (+),score=162.69 gnl/Chilomastix_cuspidata/1179:48-1073(+)